MGAQLLPLGLDARTPMNVALKYWRGMASVVASALVLLLGISSADASTMSTWEVEVDLKTGRSEAVFEIPASRLLEHGVERPEKEAPVPEDWRQKQRELTEHLEDHLHISNRAQTCQPTRGGALEAFERGGRTWLRWRTARKCALPLGRLEFVNTSLTRSRFGFHHLGTIRVGEKTYRHVFDTTNPAFQLDFSEPTASSSASSEASNNAPTLLLLSLSVIALFVVGGWFWRRR